MAEPTKVSPLFIVVAVLALSIGVFMQISGVKEPVLPTLSKTVILPKPKPLNDAQFTDHNGQPFSLEQMRGKWSILFFGFTNCPDICPTTMQTLSAVKKKVGAAGQWNNYQVIMVSVDPERDTTERLANYVPYFDSEFIGLSSSVDATTAFAKQLGILFVKRDEADAANNAGFYQVDHSASIILINPEGQWAGAITAPHKVDEISEDLIQLAQYSAALGPQDNNQEAQAKSQEASQKSTQEASPAFTDDALTINGAWIRPAPPKVPSMAAYFELTNNSDRDITIVDVQSNAFAHAMIHGTSMNDGVASMHHLDELNLPANSKVVLAPLDLHVMLMQPERPLSKGESAEISLTGTDGKIYTFEVEVREQP